MRDWDDHAPDCVVRPAEYRRLLGYPPGHALTGRAAALADQASAWYAQHGRPWMASRYIEGLEVSGPAIRVAGCAFACARLAATLRKADAHAAVLVAVSAGPELEAEARRRWAQELPDEYFFLESLGSAVVEHLVVRAGARLCEEADGLGFGILPHYSPGYTGWDIADQPRLLSLIRDGRAAPLPGALEVLPSGMLRPKKALLALFGVTRHADRLRRITELSPCQNCTYPNCRYRRAPCRHEAADNEPLPLESAVDRGTTPAPAPLDHLGEYAVNPKALRRWARERLTLTDQIDGSVQAVFRYEGTTCSDLGHPLAFRYTVTLGPRELGYPIQTQECVPAPDDQGYLQMCQYKERGTDLLDDIARDRPLLGRPLNEVLQWSRTPHPAGCYCQAQSRDHKWGLVLETVHFAMVEREKNDQILHAGGAGIP